LSAYGGEKRKTLKRKDQLRRAVIDTTNPSY